jgi:diadenosine tetraphosphate (Ap4A) HIT family hydrolase
MNFLYPLSLVTSFYSFFGNVSDQSPATIKEETIVYSGKVIKAIVPQCPLATGSFQIAPKLNAKELARWPADHHMEAYATMQKIVQYWKVKGIEDYLIYGKASDGVIFNWEIVPYPKEGWRLWKQFKVLWHMTFGGSCMPQVEREKIAKDIHPYMTLFLPQMERVQVVANDAFCKPEVIAKQRVFEGKEINVLYNYAPIGKEKLHFLLVPKRHLAKFSQLSPTEYEETMQLTQKLLGFYKNKGLSTAYIFDKTGLEAGQSVPHWHEHIVFTATKTQEFFGKLTVLKNMLIGSSSLSQEELNAQVKLLQNELANPLKDEPAN